MRAVVDTYHYGDFVFQVELDTGTETGSNQLTVFACASGEEKACLLRDFYFEEANDEHIRNFCRKFALDEDYRRHCLAGGTRWAKRNRLFVRNIRYLPDLAACEEQIGYEAGDREGKKRARKVSQERDRIARGFFRWIDTHVEEILALPEYQRIQALDSAFQPSMHEIDPLILPAVRALNGIEGVVTQFSCQGISGKVHFQGRDLLVVSPHDEYAYVTFQNLSPLARARIAALLPSFPSISSTPFSLWFNGDCLSSAGDNFRFRDEILALARMMGLVARTG